MKSEDAITVEYSSNGKEFEILVKPNEALKYRNHEIEDVSRVLFVQEVFKDASAAERASSEDVEEVFGTSNVLEVCKKILEKGKFELTTKQKRELKEKKKKQIINLIVKRSKNPQTNSPHPPKRIKNAIEEINANIDPLISAEEQIPEIIDKIRPKIPITLEEKDIAIKIPNKYIGKSYGVIKKMSKIQDEEWGDKAFYAKIKMPAGVEPDLMEKLEKLTQGNVEIKDL